MNINIVCVGTIKERYLSEAIQEYSTRLSKWASVKIIELAEEKLPKNYSDKDIENVKSKEGKRILDNIKGYTILMDISGKELTSVELSEKIDTIKNTSSTITFVIGGSYGVSDEVRNMANARLSFSKMTFPHQLFRVMLLEQIYRAFTISNNVAYHK